MAQARHDGETAPAERMRERLGHLGTLPRSDEHWIGGWHVFEIDEGRRRVAAVVWMDRATRLVRSCNLVDEDVAAEALIDELVAAMGEPLPGCGECVPRRLSVPAAPLVDALSGVLEALGVRVDEVAAEELEDALLDVAATLAYADMAYLHTCGVAPGQVARFFDKAAQLWSRQLCQRTSPLELFSISGLRPFPVMVSLCHKDGDAYIRIYVAHLDHVIGDILETPDTRGLHVLFLTFAREGETEGAYFEEARRHGWTLPAPDLVPLLSVADHADGVRPPDPVDFDTAADVLEAVLHWDGQSPLDGRRTFTVGSHKVQISWPVHVPLPSSRREQP